MTWRSKKQSVVARSAEAEFRTMAQGICEGMWLRRLLLELKIPFQKSMRMLCDNQAAKNIAKNPVHHEIDRHFIKEKIEEGTIKMVHIPTTLQTENILTKALPRTTVEDLCFKLGMINIYNPT